jgi:hypothetical protein
MTPADWLELASGLFVVAYLGFVWAVMERAVDRVTPDRLRRGRAWYRRGQ